MKRNANYRRRYPKKSVRKTRKSSRRPRVTKSVKRYVKRTIHRLAENKTIGSQLSLAGNPVNAASSGWVTNNVFPLTPNDTTMIISQNNSQQGRIGNKISIRKATLKYILVPTPYNATTNSTPQCVDIRVMIFSFKQDPVNGVNGNISQFSTLYQNGSSSSGFANTLSDQLQSFNTDDFHIYYDKQHKIGASNHTGTGQSAGSQYFANNDYKFNVMRKVSCAKYLSKQYGWNDSTTKPHSGKAVYVAFIPSLATGDQAGASQQYFKIWYDMKLDYEDL